MSDHRLAFGSYEDALRMVGATSGPRTAATPVSSARIQLFAAMVHDGNRAINTTAARVIDDTYVPVGVNGSGGVVSYPEPMSVSRRDVLKLAATAPGLVGFGAAAASLRAAPAAAALGTLLDYAAGVIPAGQIRAAGAAGSIRYVSDRRPGGSWMLGKPIQIAEARDLASNGLKIVSCYQYGKGKTADWLGGAAAGVQHARRGMQLHAAAGGPPDAPIYASIDDDPSYDQYKQQIAPYLRSWESVIGHQRTGVYGNSKTIDWALQDGLGSYFWQHNWGSPRGYAHPAANLHQVEIDKRQVGGVGVDINHILKARFGQWI